MEPTPEQFAEWLNTAVRGDMPNRKWSPARPGTLAADVACLAYAAGADAELDACCNLVEQFAQPVGYRHWGADLRTARRPKPPSLKQQALDDLRRLACQGAIPDMDTMMLIHRIEDAINAIPDD